MAKPVPVQHVEAPDLLLPRPVFLAFSSFGHRAFCANKAFQMFHWHSRNADASSYKVLRPFAYLGCS